MIASDTFTKFAQTMAITQGCPYIVIAETPNPIRQLDAEALSVRAAAMLPTVIDGLTMQPSEIERRFRQPAQKQSRSQDVARLQAKD